MIGSIATPVAISPVDEADAAESADIYIDDEATDPSPQQDLNAGQTYTFNIVVGYEVPEGKSAEIQVNLLSAGDTVTREVTGTGEYEEQTITVTKKVDKDLIGDSFRINALVDGDDINIDYDAESYAVVAPGDPPNIDSTNPSTENTVVVEQGETRSFSVSASDPDNDDLEYTWYIKEATGDYKQVASGSSSYSHSFDEPIDDGETAYYLKVEVEDNYHVVSTEWLIDVGPENQDRSPSVSRVSPSSQDIPIGSGDTKQFEVEVSDPDTDYDRLVWSVDGSQVDTRTGFPGESSFTDSFEYTFETGESHSVSAKIIDSNGNSDSLSWGTKQPDLTVTNVEVDPSEPQPGETAQIRMTIENTGDATAETVDHEIRVDGGNTIVPPATTLEPGESLTRTRDYEFSEGSHTVTGYVDPDNKIAESDEENNQQSISTDAQTPRGPLTVTAKNENGEAVSDAKIILYDDADGDWNAIEAKRTGTDGIVSWSALETGTYNVEMYGPSGGYWGTKADIVIDTANTDVTIKRTAPKVSNIKLTDRGDGVGALVTNETAILGPVVENKGPTRATRVRILIDSNNDGKVDINKTRGGLDTTVIESGSTQEYGYEYEPSSAGTKQYRIVTETYLNNNWTKTDETEWRNLVVEEKNVEASITDFNPQSGEYAPGDVIDSTVTIKNHGNVRHEFFVGYSLIGPDDTEFNNDGTTDVDITLNPGEKKTVEVSLQVPQEASQGEYDVVTAVWKDRSENELTGRLDENRRNNIIFIEPTSSKTNIEWVSPPPQNISPGESFEISVKGRSEGDGEVCLYAYDGVSGVGTTPTYGARRCKDVSPGSFSLTFEFDSPSQATVLERNDNFALEGNNNIQFWAELVDSTEFLELQRKVETPRSYLKVSKDPVKLEDSSYSETEYIYIPSANPDVQKWKWISIDIYKKQLEEPNMYRVKLSIDNIGKNPDAFDSNPFGAFTESLDGNPNSQVIVMNQSNTEIKRIESTTNGKTRTAENAQDIGNVVGALSDIATIPSGGVAAYAGTLIKNYAENLAFDFVEDYTDLGNEVEFQTPGTWKSDKNSEGNGYYKIDFSESSNLVNDDITEINEYTLVMDIKITGQEDSSVILLPDMRGSMIHNTQNGYTKNYILEHRRQYIVPLENRKSDSSSPTDKWTGVTEVDANSTQTGTITPQSDEDTVSIPVQQGDVLNHTLEKPEGADIRLRVTYPSGSEQVGGDKAGDESKSTLNVSRTITDDGVVEITVTSTDDATGDWTLTNSRQHEADEYIATQPREVTPGTTVTGRINTIDDQDVVEIPVEAGQQLNLSLSRTIDNSMIVTYPNGDVEQSQAGPDYGQPRSPLYENATIQESGVVKVQIYSATKAFRDAQDTGPWTLDVRSPAPAEPTTGTLAGTVTDDTDAPATGAQVSINDGKGTTTTVSEEGSYRFTEVYAGEYTVEVSGENYTTKTVSVEVTPGQTTTQDIEVTRDPPEQEPVLTDYTDEDDIVDNGGLRDAVADWRAGEIDADLLREVVNAWRSGEPIE